MLGIQESHLWCILEDIADMESERAVKEYSLPIRSIELTTSSRSASAYSTYRVFCPMITLRV